MGHRSGKRNYRVHYRPPPAVGPVQVIGTYGTDGSWLWAWDNSTIVPDLKKSAEKMREYGTQHGIPDLIANKIGCTQQRGS